MNKNQESEQRTSAYTLTRLKKSSGGAVVSLTPDQARRKIALLSQFITEQWGSGRPKLYESIDQELLEEYESFIDPYVLASLPVPLFKTERQDTSETHTTESKVCKGCLRDKPLTAFYSRTRSRDGRHTKCKECMLSEARKRKTPMGV